MINAWRMTTSDDGLKAVEDYNGDDALDRWHSPMLRSARKNA